MDADFTPEDRSARAKKRLKKNFDKPPIKRGGGSKQAIRDESLGQYVIPPVQSQPPKVVEQVPPLTSDSAPPVERKRRRTRRQGA